MPRLLSRILYLLSFFVALVASVVVYFSLRMAPATNATTFTARNVILLAGILIGVAIILALAAWIGALIKTARLARWSWFIVLLLISWLAIPMLIYIFVGPQTRAGQPQANQPL